MPGFYQKGEYDVSGTIVGAVEKSRMLDGRGIKPGDAVIGLASSGLHTNGYSLARKVFFDILKLKPRSRVPDLFAARTVPIPGGAPPASGPAGCGAQTNPAPPRRAPRRRSEANPPSLRPYISFLGRAP